MVFLSPLTVSRILKRQPHTRGFKEVQVQKYCVFEATKEMKAARARYDQAIQAWELLRKPPPTSSSLRVVAMTRAASIAHSRFSFDRLRKVFHGNTLSSQRLLNLARAADKVTLESRWVLCTSWRHARTAFNKFAEALEEFEELNSTPFESDREDELEVYGMACEAVDGAERLICDARSYWKVCCKDLSKAKAVFRCFYGAINPAFKAMLSLPVYPAGNSLLVRRNKASLTVDVLAEPSRRYPRWKMPSAGEIMSSDNSATPSQASQGSPCCIS